MTLLLALTLACRQGGDPADGPGTSDTPDTLMPTADSVVDSTSPGDPTEGARRAFADAGFVVQEGVLDFATYEGCCDDGAKCLGNNPATPYGSYALPAPPGDALPPPIDIFEPWGPTDPGLARSYRMRSDEALVWIGTLPPEAKYFSLRGYLITSVNDQGQLTLPMGAVGPSLNHLVIAEQRGVTPAEIWGEPIVVITTLDAAIERQVEQLLVEAGFDAGIIHHDRLPPALVKPGLEPVADTFHVSLRVAVDADPAAGEAYRASPGATLLRLTPSGAETLTDPHDEEPLPPEGSGTDESAWFDAGVELGQALVEHHGADNLLSTVSIAPRQDLEGLDCLYAPRGCAGFLPDRYAVVSPQFVLPPADVGYAVVFGVNHEITGKASYSNFAVVSDIHGMGVVGVDSAEMIGSARAFLPDHPQVDDLYAYVVSRDCSPHDVPCVEVPYGCPGVEPLENMQITIRAYLEPATGRAPVIEEMLPDQLMLFTVP